MTNPPIPDENTHPAGRDRIHSGNSSHAAGASRPAAGVLQHSPRRRYAAAGICTSLMTGRLREFTVSTIEHALPQALRDEKMMTDTIDCPQAAQAGYFVAVTVIPRLDPEEAQALLPGSYLTYLDELMEEMGQCEDISPHEETLGVTPWAHFIHWVYCCDGARAQVHLTLITEALKKGSREIAILAEDLLTPQEQQDEMGTSRWLESRRPPPVVSAEAPTAVQPPGPPPPVPPAAAARMVYATSPSLRWITRGRLPQQPRNLCSHRGKRWLPAC